MTTKILRKLRLAGPAIAAALAIAAMAACGGAAQPATDAPQPTAPPADTAADTSPSQLMAAPKFELPDTSGETVSLDSYIGNKNVVVVFYRGFW